ncbi:hypothetical protein G6O69_06790 [Pseudenhygromyxa sp. WMMC2535]|uniref:hypothetical protein n=1 Tax=Pseudenhygromyxa sp. WMMC2535 TaxID=2712867 RepID=UPI001595D868|nr:hypothetical protein [Pseudenhygromyxa sp. WMMC2535]NVB37533.1 hypothetical protein [Pseudenhygromyxa sp. WMMC2535]
MHALAPGAEEALGMLSTLHEGLVSLFHRDPGLAVRLVRGIDGRTLTRDPGRLVDRHAAFHRDAERVLRVLPRSMDLLLVHDDPEDKANGAAIVLEVQLDHDPDKQRRIASYLGLVVDRHDLPVHLGVVSLQDNVSRNLASWEIGTALKVHPYVFDRRSVPRVDSVSKGLLQPVDTILSGVVHGHHGDLEAAVTALEVARRQPPKLRQRYTATVLAALPKEHREIILGAMPVEEQMQVSQLERRCGTFLAGQQEGRLEGQEEGRLEGQKEGRLEGQKEGRREGTLRILGMMLSQRGLVPDAGQWAQLETASLEQLEAWATRIPRVTNVAELLAPSGA